MWKFPKQSFSICDRCCSDICTSFSVKVGLLVFSEQRRVQNGAGACRNIQERSGTSTAACLTSWPEQLPFCSVIQTIIWLISCLIFEFFRLFLRHLPNGLKSAWNPAALHGSAQFRTLKEAVFQHQPAEFLTHWVFSGKAPLFLGCFNN